MFNLMVGACGHTPNDVFLVKHIMGIPRFQIEMEWIFFVIRLFMSSKVSSCDY
jgi:hypothetical protein